MSKRGFFFFFSTKILQDMVLFTKQSMRWCRPVNLCRKSARNITLPSQMMSELSITHLSRFNRCFLEVLISAGRFERPCLTRAAAYVDKPRMLLAFSSQAWTRNSILLDSSRPPDGSLPNGLTWERKCVGYTDGAFLSAGNTGKAKTVIWCEM